MTGSVFLGGGGSECDEAPLWDELFESGQRVLYLPFALPASEHGRGRSWLRDSLAPRGRFDLEMWTLLPGRGAPDLESFDVVFVGGGNTFDLLDHLQRHDLLSPLRDYVATGGRLYGGSAGAVLLGADIAIAESADPNDAGVTNTAGLDLIAGLVVRPHYTPELDPELSLRAASTGETILAIPERGGVVVTGDIARCVGPQDVTVIGAARRTFHPAGRSWRLLA
ncbi:Type 1 glutamine amidotransferase-like domain-containing protein [Pengzhenrongella sp.]|uniref:Type 1 glutamine amidotransferase-like domain-containing protein n=1 Tax=Pengzhenrongella sp. TaxID=2888820 RepID=UPI002F93ADA5